MVSHIFVCENSFQLGVKWVIGLYAQLHKQCQMIFQCDFTNLHFYPQWMRTAIIPNTSQHLELPGFLYLAIWWVCRTPVCSYQLITNEVGHCIICCHLDPSQDIFYLTEEKPGVTFPRTFCLILYRSLRKEGKKRSYSPEVAVATLTGKPEIVSII